MITRRRFNTMLAGTAAALGLSRWSRMAIAAPAQQKKPAPPWNVLDFPGDEHCEHLLTEPGEYFVPKGEYELGKRAFIGIDGSTGTYDVCLSEAVLVDRGEGAHVFALRGNDVCLTVTGGAYIQAYPSPPPYYGVGKDEFIYECLPSGVRNMAPQAFQFHGNLQLGPRDGWLR